VNGNEIFARVVRQVLRPDMRILNLGAGVGTTPVHFDHLVSSVVGLDIDTSIANNPRVSSKVRGTADWLPFRAGSFDLVYLDWVIEHLGAPYAMACEAIRVLKPGGYLLFRTGNLLHYSYLIARITPQRFHEFIAGLLHAESEIHVYPTYYAMNTMRSVRRTMKSAGFEENGLTMMEADPAYVGMSRLTFLVGVAYERLVNRFRALSPLRANILGCYRKPL
jgi:ubiquinone/menaquinone biosynthesis C-methylase UbiE